VIRLEDAEFDRSSRSLEGFPDDSPFSQYRRREMSNELDRLMTITDLSEMLSVPVDTLYGWRHRGEGPAGYRIGRHVRYRRTTVEAWLDTQARPAPGGNVAHIERRRLQQRDASGRTRTVVHYKVRCRDATSETKTRLVDAERRKAEIEVALATATW
jgi:excisionase family DNA binding protein